jgi:glucose-6-phosphate isomerase
MVTEALRPYGDDKKLRIHFVSNIDGAHLYNTTRPLNVETTMVIL